MALVGTGVVYRIAVSLIQSKWHFSFIFIHRVRLFIKHIIVYQHMLICQLRQSAPIPSPARSTQGLLATQRPVFPVRGGTPKPPMPTTQTTCLKTKTTAGTLTGVQDRGVSPWTLIYVGSFVMYQNVVRSLVKTLDYLPSIWFRFSLIFIKCQK